MVAKIWFWSLQVFSLTLPILTMPAIAQIVPDNSLGTESSIVNQVNDVTDQINGGALRGSNLLHSFQEFNVNSGKSVFFSDPGVANIFSRITGVNPSQIFGELGVLGNANLFLINPNGIVFGPNARLNLTGAFVGTTAQGVVFDNGFEFSAQGNPPLLTINTPIGLNLGENTGSIQVEGAGHNFIFNALAPTFLIPSATQLEVATQQTLALIGSPITINGGVLVAPDGQIILASVESGNVDFSLLPKLEFSFEDVNKFGLLSLNNTAAASASGLVGGRIIARADILKLAGGSGFFIQNASPQVINSGTSSPGISITVNNLELERGLNVPTLAFPGRGFADINIQDTSIVSGGIIDGNLIPPGTPLDLLVTQFSLSLDEAFTLLGFVPTFIQVESLGAIPSKNINISANEVNVLDGSVIISRNFSTGSGGNITLQSSNLVVEGFSNTPGFVERQFEIVSSIAAESFGAGQGGSIALTADNISVLQGGSIRTWSLASGNAGNLQIDSSESIQLSGGVPNFVNARSNISSLALEELPNAGNAGNIAVNTSRLNIQSGAFVSSVSLAFGNSGSVTINAQEINVSGQVTADLRSEIASFAGGGFELDLIVGNDILPPPGIASGDAGSLFIKATSINVNDEAIIAVANIGSGNGGTLFIEADQITLGERGNILADTASGNSGTIELVANQLSIDNDAIISAGAGGTGNGGNITLQVGELLVDGGQISASAATPVNVEDFINNPDPNSLGRGGNISITANNLVFDAGLLEAIATGGVSDGGAINIQAGSATISDSTIEASSQVPTNPSNNDLLFAGSGGNINLAAEFFRIKDSEISASAIGGSGSGGNINISSEIALVFNSTITANAFGGAGGNIQLAAQGFFSDPESRFEASSELGIDGTVVINTPELEIQPEIQVETTEIVSPETIIVNSCLGKQPLRNQGNLSLANGNASFSSASGLANPALPSLEELKTQGPQPWQPGDPIIPGNRLVRTNTGELLWVSNLRNPCL